MTDERDFVGFGHGATGFLHDLARNNVKDWFVENKERYERELVEPARRFVMALGARLHPSAPGIVAEPRINGSIFRIYRDTRFSKDKTPYKTHLGIFLWEGAGKKMESSGFYFHLEESGLMLGTGIHCFSKPLLDAYRQEVVHPKHGPALVAAIGEVAAAGDYAIGGEHYKRVPRGFDAEHPHAELLKYNGLWVSWNGPVPASLTSARLVEFVARRYEAMLPVHRWLLGMTERLK